jgi:hypothetical protein
MSRGVTGLSLQKYMSLGGYPCGDTCHWGGYPCGDTCLGVGIPAEIHVTGLGIPAEIHRIHWVEIIGLYTPEKCRLMSFRRRVFTCLSFLVLSPFFETFEIFSVCTC